MAIPEDKLKSIEAARERQAAAAGKENDVARQQKDKTGSADKGKDKSKTESGVGTLQMEPNAKKGKKKSDEDSDLSAEDLAAKKAKEQKERERKRKQLLADSPTKKGKGVPLCCLQCVIVSLGKGKKKQDGKVQRDLFNFFKKDRKSEDAASVETIEE